MASKSTTAFLYALAAVAAASTAGAESSATTTTLSNLSSSSSDHRRLAGGSSKENDAYLGGSNGAFLDGTETLYDDYAMAWRFLGFYKDCNVCIDQDESGDDGSEVIADDASACVIGQNQDTTVCRRYALWAAYADENYEGHGASEYQYYDRKTRGWNDAGCEDKKHQRCIKMDCHDPYSSNYQLLGVFKDPDAETFLQSMTTYGGDCVWDDEEYKFMAAMNPSYDGGDDDGGDDDGQQQQQQIASWPPSGCTIYNDGGVVYYYDAVPQAGGNLGVGLFTDADCTIKAEANPRDDRSKATAQEILGRARGSYGETKSKKIAKAFGDELEAWNSAMDAFKVCQPCVSYDARLLFDDEEGTASEAHNQNGDRYQQQQGDDDAAEDDLFSCRDNLEQDEPVNQCKVLVQNGRNTMKAASYRDILLAESQGVVTGIDVAPADGSRKKHLVMGEPFVEPKHTGLSVLLLLLGFGYFGYALSRLFEKDRSKNSNKNRSGNSNSANHNERFLEYEDDYEKKKQQKQQQQQQQQQQKASDEPRRKRSGLSTIMKKFSRSKDDDSKDGSYYNSF